MRHSLALCIPNLNWQSADTGVRWHVVPYALCLLAATVRDICDVTIVDANLENLSEETFESRLREGAYDVVGVSVMMDQFAAAGHKAVAAARRALPHTVTIMGGVYPTVSAEDALGDANLDFALCGEGEVELRNFLLHLWQGAPFPAKGISFRAPDGTLSVSRSELIRPLDALPLPAYDLVDFPRYTMNAPRKAVDGPVTFPYAHILTSRGCPQGCCFCQVKHISGNRFRPRSPENILKEIEWLKENWGIRSLIFDDDNIVTQRSRAVKLFSGMIERGLDLPWKAIAMAVFKLDEELIDLMARSGCRYFSVAIESGSPRILKEIIHKPIDHEYARRMIAHARSRGIFVAANFIVGFPTETWSEVRQTIEAAEMLNVDYAKIFSAIPLRHTALWDLCERTNSFKPGFSVEKISWNEGQIISPHFDPRELTILRAYEWDRINFATEEKRRRICEMMQISEGELEELRRETRKAALARLERR